MRKLSVAGFTNIGYRFHARSHDPVGADLSGKTAVVTGASGGIGLETARALAHLGARVAIVGRDAAKLARAADSIAGEVATYQADLSLMSEVRSLAAEIRAEEGRVDILINNVGVLIQDRARTSEGMEATLATNLAGHFLLTNLLAVKLIESSPARVINVTSGGMYSERIKPDDLQFAKGRYSGTAAYARTKRGQVILTDMWADRLAGTGVVVHSMHPGWARTSGVENSLPTFNKVMGPFLRTPEQGADTIVWLASAAEAGESSGGFWFDRAMAPKHLVERTKESAGERAALWHGLVKLTRSDLEVLPVMSG
jgi:NAD(P)-dependent dehydrogenase (short-subunit alcohol dehydrogenase family)